MDTADLQVMSCPPFDPAADVRITHRVQQGRATGGDGNHQSRGVILNHYLRGPSVGKGQHGTVFKCWDLAQNSVEVVRLPFPFIPFSFISPHPLSTFPHVPRASLHVHFCPALTPASLTNVCTVRPLTFRLSKSSRATTPAPTGSTSSRGRGYHAQGPTCPSPTTSEAKNTKSKKRSQS